MKLPKTKTILSIIIALFAPTLLGEGSVKTNLTLAWDYPTNQFDTNLVFILRYTTNAAISITNWPVIQVINGSNRQTTVAMSPSVAFFVMTASNLWGEGFFSNVAAVPPPPTSSLVLTIR